MRRFISPILAVAVALVVPLLHAQDEPTFGPRLVAPPQPVPVLDDEPEPPAESESIVEELPSPSQPGPSLIIDAAPIPIDRQVVEPPATLRPPVAPPTAVPPRALHTVGPTGPREVRRATAAEPLRAPLRIDVGEDFLNRWFARREAKRQAVNDVVLEANVQGWQTTTTAVSIDCVPCETGGRIDFRLLGETNSDTLGLTEKATLRTLGQHRFRGTKPVLLHGDQFLVKKAAIHVEPSSQTVGAWTKYDEVPLLNRIATRTAFDRAAESRPAAEKITADRIAERVLPEFNGEVDGSLDGANRLLRERKQELVEKELWPTRLAPSSTDISVRLDAWYGDAEAGIPDLPTSARARSDEMRVAVHESLVAKLVERAELGGMVVTKADVEELFRSLPEGIEVTKPKADDAEGTGAMAALVKFVLDEDRPVAVEFANGRAFVTLRIRIRPAFGGDLPAHDVRLAVQGELGEQGIVFTTEDVTVTRVDGTDDAASKMLAKLLGEQLHAQLPAITLPRWYAVPTQTAKGTGSVQVTSLGADDGWLFVRGN